MRQIDLREGIFDNEDFPMFVVTTDNQIIAWEDVSACDWKDIDGAIECGVEQGRLGDGEVVTLFDGSDTILIANLSNAYDLVLTY